MYHSELVTIPNNPTYDGMAAYQPDVCYSEKTGMKLQVLFPWRTPEDTRKYPLILFVQGSAWQTPNMYAEIPQLSAYAKRGYVVASVCHRNCTHGFPFPAYLEDCKTALRYLRAHAGEYGIDKERVCAFGTSSGGNTVLLMGLTGDDARYQAEEYAEESDAVQAVVECFGPTDMETMAEAYVGSADAPALIAALAGGQPMEKVVHDMSPLKILEDAQALPPVFILHGDADRVVPFDQGERMYAALKEKGAHVEMTRVAGAGHEGTFWSAQTHRMIHDFIDRALKG